MAPHLSTEAWAQIRHDYERGERKVEYICAEHGISSGTLRDRMRRWGWTRRREPIPFEGPPPLPEPRTDPRPLASAVPVLPAARAAGAAAPSAFWTVSPHAAAPHAIGGEPPAPEPAFGRRPALPGWEGEGEGVAAPGAASEADAARCEIGDGALVSRLQSAVARVLPAIEQTVARLAGGAAQPREMEGAGRALGALTRTLRELNGLLRERQAAASAAGRPGYVDDDMPEDIDAFRFELARRINAFVASRTQAAGDDALPRPGDDATAGSDAAPSPGDAQSDSAPPAQPRVRSL